MVATIDQVKISTFRANLHMLAEQNGSKLKGIFAEEIVKGQKHFFDRLGNLSVTEKTARNAVTPVLDAAFSRRMATLATYQQAVQLDPALDLNEMLMDPSNEIIKKLANAHGKQFDVVLINALLGSAATGADGSGSQAFDTSNQQIAHGSVGLTYDKLLQAIRILQSNEVDIDSAELVLLVNARGEEDLLADAKFVSSDYQNTKVIGTKNLPAFRGVAMVRTERLPAQTAGSVYRAILTTSDALRVAIAKDMVVRVDERQDLSYAKQIYTEWTYGAVRMEEAKVVDILFQ